MQNIPNKPAFDAAHLRQTPIDNYLHQKVRNNSVLTWNSSCKFWTVGQKPIKFLFKNK